MYRICLLALLGCAPNVDYTIQSDDLDATYSVTPGDAMDRLTLSSAECGVAIEAMKAGTQVLTSCGIVIGNGEIVALIGSQELVLEYVGPHRWEMFWDGRKLSIE